MTFFAIATVVVAIATVVSAWRTWRSQRSARTALVVLQIVAAALLVLMLFPPTRSTRGDVLRVLSPGATAAQVAASDPASRVVALPGVDVPATIERVPDLGTALRRHPRVDAVRVVGAGLPARDRDAARGLALEFDAVPAKAGIVGLAWPERIDTGSVWRLHGRVDGVDGTVRVELRDRADVRIGAIVPDARGRFAIDVRAKGEGAATYTLRLLAEDDRVVESVPVGVVVDAGERVRVLLLAGALDAEWKYLRRWALDAGIDLRARMAVSRGIAVRDGELRLDAETLRTSDLVILDERSWAGLSRVDKESLLAAVDGGLGVLLRVTAPLPATVAREWEALGWRMRASDVARTVRLPALAGSDVEGPTVERQPLEVNADGAIALVVAADGATLASWRARGRGRIGVWWLAESYPLVLNGDAARFGMLWREAMVTLARARAPTTLHAPRLARVDARTSLCGITGDAKVETPEGAAVVLAVDPSTPGCAAYWPSQAGWHRLVEGEARVPFFVFAADQGLAIEHADADRATRALAAASVPGAPRSHAVAGPRWPWFLAWLAVSAVLWWLERQRVPVLGDR